MAGVKIEPLPVVDVDAVGEETLREYERRAGITYAMLYDMVKQDRVRFKERGVEEDAESLVYCVPGVEGVGRLWRFERTKAYRMLQILAEFRDGPENAKFSLRHAYTSAEVSRGALTVWRRDHPMFDSLMEDIQLEMVDTMKAEAYRRSVIGHDEPLVHQGVKTGETIKKYSDSLLQFTLMGYDAKFRAKDVNVAVSGQLNTNVNIEGLRDRLAQRLQAVAKSKIQGEESPD
jgi:hypothetical protein